MPELLHVPDEVTAVRPLRQPAAVLDPATDAVVRAAIAEADARARREGEAAGRAAALDEMAQAAGAVGTAIDRLLQEVMDQRALATRASLELAERAATAVLDRTPADDALEVLERVLQAIDVLDVDPIEVRVSPTDHATLTQVALDRRVELVADPSLAAGDAVVGTPAAGAELTRGALLGAALAALGEGAA